MPREVAAYDAAVAETLSLRDGDRRMKLIHMVLIDRTYTICGAAQKLYISEIVGKRWHSDFIRRVGRQLGFKLAEKDTSAAEK